MTVTEGTGKGRLIGYAFKKLGRLWSRPVNESNVTTKGATHLRVIGIKAVRLLQDIDDNQISGPYLCYRKHA